MVAVPIAGRTRSNITLAEPDGTVTKINEPGPALSAAEFDAIADGRARRRAAGRLGGRLRQPAARACRSDVYAGLCRRLVAAGVARGRHQRTRRCGRGRPRAPPWSSRTGRSSPRSVGADHSLTLGDVDRRRGQQLRAWGAGAVLASLGADGAVLVEDDGVVTAIAPVAEPRSTVGAGDALLAGFLAAGARGEAALAEAPGLGRGGGQPARQPHARARATCEPRTASVSIHRPIRRPATAVTSRTRQLGALVTPGPRNTPSGPPREGEHPMATLHPHGPQAPASRPPSSGSAATWPAWSCPTSARSSPGA